MQSYNEKSDVYSFGVILWELFTGQEPWHDKSPMQARHPCPSAPVLSEATSCKAPALRHASLHYQLQGECSCGNTPMTECICGPCCQWSQVRASSRVTQDHA